MLSTLRPILRPGGGAWLRAGSQLCRPCWLQRPPAGERRWGVVSMAIAGRTPRTAGGAARGLTEEELLGVLQARLAFGRIIAMHCHPPTLYQTH